MKIVILIIVLMQISWCETPKEKVKFSILNFEVQSHENLITIKIENKSGKNLSITNKEIEGIVQDIEVVEELTKKSWSSFGPTPFKKKFRYALELAPKSSMKILTPAPSSSLFSEPVFDKKIFFYHSKITNEFSYRVFRKNRNAEMSIIKLKKHTTK